MKKVFYNNNHAGIFFSSVELKGVGMTGSRVGCGYGFAFSVGLILECLN